MNWSEYASWDRDKLQFRLAEVSEELAGRYEELSRIQAEEIKAKVSGWLEEGAVTGRELAGRLNASDLTSEIFTLKGLIAAVTEERDLLRVLLDAP